MSATVWDQEFFRRRATGEQAAGDAPEPTAAPWSASTRPGAPLGRAVINRHDVTSWRL
jgi:hypothetical protein